MKVLEGKFDYLPDYARELQKLTDGCSVGQSGGNVPWFSTN